MSPHTTTIYTTVGRNAKAVAESARLSRREKREKRALSTIPPTSYFPIAHKNELINHGNTDKLKIK